MLDGDPSPFRKKGAQLPIFGPYLLWPNGWMDEDATWYGGRTRPRRHCIRWRPCSPPPEIGTEPPLFGPCLLWPKGWMDQDVTWYEVGLGPGDIVLDGDPAHQKGVQQPPLFGHVYCGQTAGWKEASAQPHCVGSGLSPRKGHRLVAKWLDGSRCHLVRGLGPGDIVLDWDPASQKGYYQPPLFGPCLLWPNGLIDQNATRYRGRPRPGRHCVRWETSSPTE